MKKNQKLDLSNMGLTPMTKENMRAINGGQTSPTDQPDWWKAYQIWSEYNTGLRGGSAAVAAGLVPKS